MSQISAPVLALKVKPTGAAAMGATDHDAWKKIFLGRAELPERGRPRRLPGPGLRRRCRAPAAGRGAAPLPTTRTGSFLGTPAAVVPDPDHAATWRTRTVTIARARQDLPRATRRRRSDEAADFLAPSTRPDSLGRIGHYEVLQVLGHGGFGIVFRAFDDMLQRVVAVKVLAPQLAATSPARKRFLREARSSAPGRGTRTWCRCTRSRSSRCPTWRWSSSPARRSSSGSTGSARSTCPRWCGSAGRSPRGWPPPTRPT